jgi:hypothetical protein
VRRLPLWTRWPYRWGNAIAIAALAVALHAVTLEGSYVWDDRAAVVRVSRMLYAPLSGAPEVAFDSTQAMPLGVVVDDPDQQEPAIHR